MTETEMTLRECIEDLKRRNNFHTAIGIEDKEFSFALAILERLETIEILDGKHCNADRNVGFYDGQQNMLGRIRGEKCR